MATVDFSAAQLEALRGQLDTTKHSVVVKEAQLGVAEVHEGDPPWTGDGGAGALDFISQTRGSPGFVANQARAREDTPCLCYEIQRRSGGTSELCFKHGIVGALDEPQIDLYCETKVERPPTPAQQARLEAFQESAETCKVEVEEYPKGEEMGPFISCMDRELRLRNRTLAGTQLAESDETPQSAPPEVPSSPAGPPDVEPPAQSPAASPSPSEPAEVAADSSPDQDEDLPDEDEDLDQDDDLGNGDTD
ncbi:MAG: hypothetical protein ACREN7_00150 [Candidatus Dormibacteria bacterium]